MDKENLLLADCDPQEVESLKKGLIYNGKGFNIYSVISNWKRIGKFSELKRYFAYFKTAWSIFINRKRYDALIGWQQFYALIIVFYCTVFHVKKTNMIIALNFTYREKKSKIGGIYKWFMKMCTNPKYMDYLHVLSFDYADTISNEFSFPRDRIIVTPFGVDDCYEEFKKYSCPAEYSNNGYALAIGRSNRDFDFLVKAWGKIDFPLVIIGDTYKGTNCGYSHISIRKDIAGKDSYAWIANCKMMIVPLKDPTVCSGDTVLLNAMACEKIVVVTAPSTLAEMYIIDGVNGYAISKTENEFRSKINEILSNDMSTAKCARNDFLKRFSRGGFGHNLSSILNGE